MGDSSVTPKDTVLVTGFGPFGSHTVNASWIAVQELEHVGLGENIHLITKEIPVVYEDVKKIVPELWKQYRPKLMVHVGVSGIARHVTLEQLAHNDGYDRCDVKNAYPFTKCCVDDGPGCIHSSINVGLVCEAINSSCKAEAVISTDPGRYLCDFIYYLSLSINPKCTVFVHVPPLHKPYGAEDLAQALKAGILNMLEQVKHEELLSGQQSQSLAQSTADVL